MIIEDNYYNSLIEETIFELDSLFEHENIFLAESEESKETIISKIIRKIKEFIEYIKSKLREIRNKINKFIADKMFQNRCSKINISKIENKQYQFAYFSLNKIFNDYNKNYELLRAETEYYLNNYGKYLKTMRHEDLGNINIEEDPYNFSRGSSLDKDKLNNNRISRFFDISSHLDPIVKIKFVKDRQQDYIQNITYSYNDIIDIIEKGKNIKSDPCKLLSVEKFDLSFAEKNISEINKEINRFIFYDDYKMRTVNRKLDKENENVKNKNAITSEEYHALKNITWNILSEYMNALEVIKFLSINCNELKIYSNFFSMIHGENLSYTTLNNFNV